MIYGANNPLGLRIHRIDEPKLGKLMLNPGLLLHIDGIQGDCRIPHYLGWMDTFWFSFGGTGEYGQSRHGNLARAKLCRTL